MAARLTLRLGTAAPRAHPWIVAAIALVLNWTLAGTVSFQPIFGGAPAAPGVRAGEPSAKPGNLPRAQSRTSSLSASMPKAPQSRLNAGSSKAPALVPDAPVVVAAGAPAVEPSAPLRARPAPAARIFDPRAPPTSAA